MSHQYGRHGPNAWKRWRQRRFPQRLPAIVSSVAVVRVHVPVTTERIIFIVLKSPESFDPNEPIQIPRENPLSLQPVTDNSPLAKRARIQAVDDIEEIKALIERKGPVTILDQGVVKRTMILAKDAVKNSYPPENPPDPPEYKQLVERWRDAYSIQFEEERALIINDLKGFPDGKAVNLARKARQDSEKYRFPASGRGPSYQRDLAVVSALYELGLCQNLEEHLKRIHEYVDIYEGAFRDPQEEVTWPNLDSFRS